MGLGVSIQGEWVEHERRSWAVGENLILPAILPLYPGPVLLDRSSLAGGLEMPTIASRKRFKVFAFQFYRQEDQLFLFPTA